MDPLSEFISGAVADCIDPPPFAENPAPKKLTQSEFLLIWNSTD